MDVMEWKIPLRVVKRSTTVYLQRTMFQFYLQNTIFHTNISELLQYFYNVLYKGISTFPMTIHLNNLQGLKHCRFHWDGTLCQQSRPLSFLIKVYPAGVQAYTVPSITCLKRLIVFY